MTALRLDNFESHHQENCMILSGWLCHVASQPQPMTKHRRISEFPKKTPAILRKKHGNTMGLPMEPAIFDDYIKKFI
jgi:hypothetical protein